MAKNPEDLQNIVFVCTGSDCKKRGGKDIYKTMKDAIRREKWSKDARVIRTRCTGHCKQAPVAILMPQNKWVMNQSAANTCATLLDAMRAARAANTPKEK